MFGSCTSWDKLSHVRTQNVFCTNYMNKMYEDIACTTTTQFLEWPWLFWGRSSLQYDLGWFLLDPLQALFPPKKDKRMKIERLHFGVSFQTIKIEKENPMALVIIKW